MGHGAHLTSSLTTRVFLLAAVMYVGGTDILHWAQSLYTEGEDLIEYIQHLLSYPLAHHLWNTGKKGSKAELYAGICLIGHSLGSPEKMKFHNKLVSFIKAIKHLGKIRVLSF